MPWETTTQLLERLQTEGDQEVWQTFCNHFVPVIRRWAKHMGLSGADAEDVAQETLICFIKALRDGRYDHERGRLRAWLFGMAKNTVLSYRSRLPREHHVADTETQEPFWNTVPDERAMQMTWDTQWRRILLMRCLERVRHEFGSQVFEAFHLYALCELPVREVGRRLTMSDNAVYIAKSRVLKRAHW